jgi:hypothetical protein
MQTNRLNGDIAIIKWTLKIMLSNDIMNILPAVASYDSYLQDDMDCKLVERKTC